MIGVRQVLQCQTLYMLHNSLVDARHEIVLDDPLSILFFDIWLKLCIIIPTQKIFKL